VHRALRVVDEPGNADGYRLPSRRKSMNRMGMNDNLAPHSRNSLGIQGQVYLRLLDKLNDHRSVDTQTHPERIHARREYMDPYILMVIENDDTMDRPMTLAARNISRGGVGLLHSNFIYPKTRVAVHLTVNGENPTPVRGVVLRCEHRGGVVHEIGVKFDREISIQQYLRPDISDCMQSFERVNPAELTGRALFIGSKHDFSPLSRAMVSETGLAYKFVPDTASARALDIHDYELLVILNDQDDCEGTEFVREMRDQGYKRPVILVGDIKEEFELQKVRACGADMLLPWPTTTESMLCAIGEYLLTDWTADTLAAVRSCMDKQTVEGLRGQLAKLGVQLDQHLRTGDAIRIYGTCGQIRSLSPLLGMKQLRDLTLKVGEDIAEAGNLETQRELIGDIVTMCSSVSKAA